MIKDGTEGATATDRKKDDGTGLGVVELGGVFPDPTDKESAGEGLLGVGVVDPGEGGAVVGEAEAAVDLAGELETVGFAGTVLGGVTPAVDQADQVIEGRARC